MPRIRNLHHFRQVAIQLFEDVSIDTYDRIGKRGAEAMALLAEKGEQGEFIFVEGGVMDDTVTCAYMGQGQVALKLSGIGIKGQHIGIGEAGIIIGTDTSPTAELKETELGVALADWTDGQLTECDIFKI